MGTNVENGGSYWSIAAYEVSADGERRRRTRPCHRHPIDHDSITERWLAAHSQAMVYRFGEHELDGDRFELRRSGQALKLQPKVFHALLFLVKERHRVVLRRELLEVVWCDVAVSQASVRRVIVEVRRALGDETHGTIVTVRGRGFRFAGEVVEQAPMPSSRSSALSAVLSDPRLAALGAKLEEARQLYQQLLEA